jgi:pyruvate/2-oxoglutarate dehydrogenase complex dihydrolipoamide dehydrogenase (E3) component
VLFERTDKLGGQVRAAAMAPNRAEYGRAINWLVHQVDKLGVDVRLATEADRRTVLAEQPDAVVVATGATPRPPSFPVAREARVVTCDDVLYGKVHAAPGTRVLVIDEDAHMRGPGAAEALLDVGAQVEIITKEMTVGLDIDPTLKPALFRRLFEKGVVMTPHTATVEVRKGSVLGEHVYAGTQRELPVDLVVLALGGEAREELYFDLKANARSIHLQRIGDCVAPRQLYDALLEATRAARAI